MLPSPPGMELRFCLQYCPENFAKIVMISSLQIHKNLERVWADSSWPIIPQNVQVSLSSWLCALQEIICWISTEIPPKILSRNYLLSLAQTSPETSLPLLLRKLSPASSTHCQKQEIWPSNNVNLQPCKMKLKFWPQGDKSSYNCLSPHTNSSDCNCAPQFAFCTQEMHKAG